MKRTIFIPRVFSLESAHEILTLVVRANIEALQRSQSDAQRGGQGIVWLSW